MCFSFIGSALSSISSFAKPILDIALPLGVIGAGLLAANKKAKAMSSPISTLPAPQQAIEEATKIANKARDAALADAVSRSASASFFDPSTGAQGVPMHMDLWGIRNPNRLV